MRLWLTPEQAEQIGRHALDERPDEACGIIGGVGERAHQIVPIPNRATNPRHHFYLDEKAFTEALFDFQRKGLSLIGIYHSHPKGEPIPSPVDIRQAAYPDTAYIVVGLKHGKPKLAAWNILVDRVNPVELYIGFDRPEPQDPPLSKAQKIVIIMAAVVAFLFVLFVSLSLLPPAPLITPSP